MTTIMPRLQQAQTWIAAALAMASARRAWPMALLLACFSARREAQGARLACPRVAAVDAAIHWPGW